MFDVMSTLKPSLHKGLFVNILKCLQKCSRSFQTLNSEDKHTQENTKSRHIYSKIWKFSDVKSTSEYLVGNVFYHKDGVIALTKPANLGSSKKEDSIYYCLPYLAQEFGYKYLKLVHVPDRHHSGVTILASDAKIAQSLELALRRSKAIYSKEPKQTFMAITVGHPINDEDTKKIGVTKRHKDNVKYPLILSHWGANEVKRREVNVGCVNHKVIAKSESAALVLVSTWQLRHHCPRMFLSDIMLSPVLGDNMFGPRVSSLFEKPVLIKPWHAPAVKALPPLLLQTLNVRSGAESLIPLHFHLHELVLHGYLKDGSDLVLHSEPPDFFLWTQKRLNLQVPDETRNCLTGVDTVS
ncbi:Mitochondrial RNA pseudouridine synthase RPUSD4 [Frankliniella fusca]|uniref:Mitochondrial RNA pseudouridine synthase RPUSD4 n=1 Tax=Frankliniella fusca TaxID=407009 RepID=A0AAE1H6R3_9NEOP|nr:Mitochondrial RNA pseudouridine synthase RPUSD4 [Frankliniella fusca]